MTDARTDKRFFLLACLVLALGTLALYWPVSGFSFINFDDDEYISNNPVTKAGLTWHGVQWAFNGIHVGNWHPLSWLSHMADCQLFGVNAGAHHLMNVAFHIANTLLLFAFLRSTTGAQWRSASVAALFAWHPLHVESVAWVAERKDVLSAFFWLLALLAYTRYAKEQEVGKMHTCSSWKWYFVTLFLFACGLMAKPMVVTLPFVLLLVDFWPLDRIQNSESRIRNLKGVLLEKIPFFAMAIAASLVNFVAQKAGGAPWSSDVMPPHVRLANALISYSRYLSKTFWPSDLAVIYPYQDHWPLVAVLASALFLSACTGLAVLRMRQKPFLFFGWFYFMGTLLPAIGLVQVGPQAMADRYMYLPSIGLFMLIVWGANDLLATHAHRQKIAALVAVAAGCACCLCTMHQLRFWESSVKLFAHTVAVTPDNYTATDYLGGALESAGRKDDALLFYAESVRISPYFPLAQWNLGLALLNKGLAAEAAEHLAVAAKFTPNDAVIHCYYGKALLLAGKTNPAEAQLAEAMRLKPDLAEAHFFLAVDLANQNRTDEALPHFAKVVRLEPSNGQMHFNYGLALLDQHQPDKAVAEFRAALRLQPDFPDAKKDLDALLAAHPELK
ncbi:MAG TPA: tetratricopeptide repeat protein [Verrucomicrobiae bacterium]